ncbi:MAG TPA: zf-HC2 domain-containing protein [Candidatus Acidoferrales bacterium]|nr:zf-HC2 domain-containing protein [Candidatus Acidoferrales bacterium]
MIHFDEMACLLYLEGQLDPQRAQELETHVAECAACSNLLHALQSETTLLSAALTEDSEPVPARILGEQTRRLPIWIWTLAFGAFAAFSYWVWVDGLSPFFDPLSNAGFGGTDLFTTIVFNGAFWEGWGDMMDAMQVGALILVAIVAIVWIRRRLRRNMAVAVVMSAMLLAVALPQQASAADVRRGRAVVIPAGEVIHNDLVAAGPSVRIDGTVEGDVIAFTRYLTVTGHVTGDVIGFAGVTLIDGTVDGNVRVFSQSVMLQGEIGKNLSTVSRSLNLSAKANIKGGAIALAADGDFDGKIQHDLLGLIGRGDIEGLIGGEAWVRGGSLTVASTGEIRGPATFEGPQQPEVESGAKLASPFRTEITQEVRRNRRTAARSIVRALFGYVAAVAVGVFLLLVFPGFFRATLREAESIGLPIGIGALALITGVFVWIIGVLLVFIGVGAGIAAAMAYAPVLYVAQVFVGAWLGNKIMGVAPADSNAALSAWITRLAVGLLVLRVAGFIPVLGSFVWVAVLLWGSGAVLLGFYKMSRRESLPVAA